MQPLDCPLISNGTVLEPEEEEEHEEGHATEEHAKTKLQQQLQHQQQQMHQQQHLQNQQWHNKYDGRNIPYNNRDIQPHQQFTYDHNGNRRIKEQIAEKENEVLEEAEEEVVDEPNVIMKTYE